MKWEVYKRMNNKQRLYWEFNFNQKTNENSIFYSMLLIIIVLLGLIILKVNNSSIENIKNMLIYMKFSFLMLIINLGIKYLYEFYSLYKENKWLKSEGLI